jgi:hypothetical protein
VVLLQTDPVQSPGVAGKREEMKTPWGTPGESSSTHTFCALRSGQTTPTRGSNFCKTSCSNACSRKVAEAPLASSWTHESKVEHGSSSCHVFVPAWFSHA